MVAVRDFLVAILAFSLMAAVVELTGCSSPAANVQTIRSQKKIEKKLAEEQAQPFDGGSVRKSFKRILK